METATSTQDATRLKALQPEQVDQFWSNGFLPIGKVLDDELIETLRTEYDSEFDLARTGKGSYRNLSAGSSDNGKAQNETEMLQIMQMCERNMHFRALLYHETILDMVEDLIGPNIQLFHDQALYKPAHHGGPVFWHQDNAYWRCSPPNLISCWLTLDDVDVNNGAMQFIPGSHFHAAAHARAESSDTLLDLGEQVDAAQAVVAELPAGGIAFHHCQTFHHTAPNTTDRQRRALAIHFMTPGTRSLRTGEYLGVSFSRPMLRMNIR